MAYSWPGYEWTSKISSLLEYLNSTMVLLHGCALANISAAQQPTSPYAAVHLACMHLATARHNRTEASVKTPALSGQLLKAPLVNPTSDLTAVVVIPLCSQLHQQRPQTTCTGKLEVAVMRQRWLTAVWLMETTVSRSRGQEIQTTLQASSVRMAWVIDKASKDWQLPLAVTIGVVGSTMSARLPLHIWASVQRTLRS